jgi:hypothetical protein
MLIAWNLSPMIYALTVSASTWNSRPSRDMPKYQKDISAMYACCGYGKQYEELLETAEHLGRKWYEMAKFCDTNFAQSELNRLT